MSGIFWLSLYFFLKTARLNRFLRNESFLLIPPIILICCFSLFINAQIGVRYILPALPPLFIFCGRLAVTLKHSRSHLSKIVCLLLVYLIISTLSFHPHYLSYFNELVGKRVNSYKVLADSNLDWGQNSLYLEDYLESNPETIFEPITPRSGTIIVGANSLVGVFNPERFRWLRENFEPIGHLAYSYLIFEVSQDDLKSLREKGIIE